MRSKDKGGTPLSAQRPRPRRAMRQPWRRQHRTENRWAIAAGDGQTRDWP